MADWFDAKRVGAIKAESGINWGWAYFPTKELALEFEALCVKDRTRTNPIREVNGLFVVHYHY